MKRHFPFSFSLVLKEREKEQSHYQRTVHRIGLHSDSSHIWEWDGKCTLCGGRKSFFTHKLPFPSSKRTINVVFCENWKSQAIKLNPFTTLPGILVKIYTKGKWGRRVCMNMRCNAGTSLCLNYVPMKRRCPMVMSSSIIFISCLFFPQITPQWSDVRINKTHQSAHCRHKYLLLHIIISDLIPNPEQVNFRSPSAPDPNIGSVWVHAKI